MQASDNYERARIKPCSWQVESAQHGQQASHYSWSTQLPGMDWNNIWQQEMHRLLPTRRSHWFYSQRGLCERSQELKTWCFVSHVRWVGVALEQVQKHKKHSSWHILLQFEAIHPPSPRSNVLLVAMTGFPLLPSTALWIRQRVHHRWLEELP